jgi:hypothetical protein
LPRERELSLEHAQRCSFLIILTELWSPGIRNCSRKSTVISEPIFPRDRELSLSNVQRCNFLIIEQCCLVLAVEMFPGKPCDFSNYLAKRARAQSGACAEVQFPDYRTVLWSIGSRDGCRKALQFQLLSCQFSESSVWRMRRGSVYCL